MGDRNPLGLLRFGLGVESRWNRADGVTVVKFKDGTLMRIPKMGLEDSMREAARLELRAEVIRRIANGRVVKELS